MNRQHMGTVVFAVISPGGRINLSLAGETTVGAVLPLVLEVCGADRSTPWTLTLASGRPLAAGQTLAASGVRHGSTLVLRPGPPPPSDMRPAPRDLGRLPVAELRVLSGPAAGRRVPLEPGEHRLGSHPYSRIVLRDPALARVHLVIAVGAGGSVIVAPAAPDAPCLLDGEPLAGPAAPRPGQVVRVGRSLLAFGRPGEGAAPAERPDLAVAGQAYLEAPAVPLARAGGLAIGGTAVGTALAAGVTAAVWGPHAALVPIGLAPVAGAGAVAWSRHGPAAARARFRARLADLDRTLASARSARRDELATAAPDAAELLARLEAAPRRWTRRPGQADWLRLRLGWADQPSGLAPYVAPRGAPALRTEAHRVAVRHATLHGAPVSVALAETGPLAIAGDPAACLALARWLAVQVVALHGPDDVALAAALPADEVDGFEWLPALARGREQAARLVDRLAALVVERGAARASGPAVVAILHGGVVPQAARALRGGARAGVHVIWLAAGDALLASCGAVVELPAGDAAPRLSVEGREPVALGGADGLTAELASRAAGALGTLPAAAPGRPDLADVLGAGPQPEHHVLSCWIRDRASGPPRRLRAALGLDAAGRPVELELRRTRPHVLVTGAPWTGKSRLLGCAVASLAVRHSPRTLNLVLIGRAFAGLAGLPHTLALLADPDEEELGRTLAALDAELRWRLASRGPAAPSLVVAADELPAPLTTRLLAALAGVARRGPALGLHLVLATRAPAEVEASLGAEVRARVAMGAPGAPAAAAGLDVMTAAVVSVNRMLGQPAKPDWPSGGSLQSSR